MKESDKRLQQAVIDEIGEEDALSTTTIAVEVHDGICRLIGNVHTASDRDDAEAAVTRVGGVRKIVNDLVVERPL
jgi:osmotically-inducible protein OsmY